MPGKCCKLFCPCEKFVEQYEYELKYICGNKDCGHHWTDYFISEDHPDQE